MKLLNMENMRKKILKQNKKFNCNIAYLKIIKFIVAPKKKKKKLFFLILIIITFFTLNMKLI